MHSFPIPALASVSGDSISTFRVLFVEDSLDDVALMERQLRADGLVFSSACVQTREELLEALRSASWDIILLDFNLPQLNAPEVLRILKEEQCDIPVILVSGTISEDFAVQLITAGAQDFILKSSLKRLPSAILSAVEKKTIERQRRAAEEELQQSREQLRALAAKLQETREMESLRISREIHDDLGQLLTGARLQVSRIARELSVEKHRLAGDLRSASRLIRTTIQSVHRIATELRPRVLDRFGLPAALREHLRAFEQQTGTRSSFSSSDDACRISPEAATALFRITQEALTNVVRHAHASRVTVELSSDGDHVELLIRDNGRGIVKEARGASLGLLGMQERALQLGGDLQIRSTSSGTTVGVTVPCLRNT